MKIPLGKGRNLSIDKSGAMYQTNHEGGRNLYFTKSSGFKKIVKGGINQKHEALESKRSEKKEHKKI